MSIRIPPLIYEINYKNREFTSQQIEDYFKESSKEPFADSAEVGRLITHSQNELNRILDESDISMEQPLTYEGSSTGKDIAELASRHTGTLIGLIQKGAVRRGTLV